MATAALLNTPTVIDNGESTTGWNGDTFSLEPDIKVQGSNSVACAQTTNGNNDVYKAGSWDLTAGEHLRCWVNSSAAPAYALTEASNGLQLWISDGTNTAYWTVGGSDTYAGGWTQFVVYTGNTPTSGTVPTGNTTQIGFRMSTGSKPRNVPANLWVDAWTYGDGYTVTGGTNGDEIDWSHIAAIDEVSAFNIVSIAEDTDNLFLLAGDIKVGSGATSTYFKDLGQIANFKDLSVSSTLFNIAYQGTGCNVDVDGGTYDASAAQTFSYDTSNADLSSFSLKNKTLSSGGTTIFKAGQSVTGCTFDARTSITVPNTISSSKFISCGLVTVTGNVTDCDFTNSTTAASVLTSDLSKVSGSSFTSDGSNHAVELSSIGGGSMTWDVTTSGYVAGATGSPVTPSSTGNEDVYVNVGAGTLTINVASGASIPSIRSTGATVNVVAGQVTFTLTVLDLDSGLPIENAMVYILAGTGGGLAENTPIINKVLTDVNGQVSDTRSYSSPQPIVGRVRKGTGAPYYKTSSVVGTISNADNTSLTTQMIKD